MFFFPCLALSRTASHKILAGVAPLISYSDQGHLHPTTTLGDARRQVAGEVVGVNEKRCILVTSRVIASFHLGGSQKRGFDKGGGFGRCSPVPKFPSRSCPAMLPWQKKTMIFDIPEPHKPERRHIRQNHPFTKPPFFKKRLLQKSEGIFPSNFRVIMRGNFGGPFLLGKNRGKNPPQSSKIRVWELCGQNPYCKDLALTLLFLSINEGWIGGGRRCRAGKAPALHFGGNAAFCGAFATRTPPFWGRGERGSA